MLRSMRFLVILLLFTIPALAACQSDQSVVQAVPTATSSETASIPTSTEAPLPTSIAEPSAEAEALSDSPALEILEDQAAYYVSRLPRPSDVPAGWRMDRTPRYEERTPAPGDTYRFACEELPSRSIGLAAVGYRSLDALPSMTIEYVVYPTVDDAADALEDMRRAIVNCAEFALGGDAEAPPDASLTPLDFPAYGTDSFAAALATDTSATGSLLTHVIKIQSGNVVVGINHANWGDQPPPEAAITEQMAGITLNYLDRED